MKILKLKLILIFSIISLSIVLQVSPHSKVYSIAHTYALIQAEDLTLPSNINVVIDEQASAGKYVAINHQLNFQPTAPFYSTFYYPWYKNVETDNNFSYWSDHGNTPPNTWFSHYLPDIDPLVFSPNKELYSTNDYDTFKWQVGKMYEAKIEVAISSWWGQNTKEDTALNTILTNFMSKSDNPYPNLRWCVYYEKEGFGDPTTAEIVSDLNHLFSHYANNPYFLKVNGKPVIFVYADNNDTPGTMVSRWKSANEIVNNKFYLVLKVFSGYAGIPNQPDSWHQYAPATRYGTHGTFSSYVSPGFWLDDSPSTSIRLERNLDSYKLALQNMVNDQTTWKLIETWNEWGEGTSVEPGNETTINANGQEVLKTSGMPFGNLYIDALKQYLPALENGSGLIN